MTDVALATAAELPSLIDDEDAFRTALEARDIAAEPVVWSDESVEWGEFDAVLVRTIWDYYRRANAFDAWLDRLDCATTTVWNSVRTLRWNSHKFYLRDLAERGVPTLQTAYLDRGAGVSLDGLMADCGWDEVVVKPAMSAGAFETKRISRADADAAQTWFEDLIARRDVLVQRFADEIEAGEWSLVFFDGAYSHAWNSLPASDDVTTFDGIDADYEPDSRVQRRASAALAATRDALDLDPADLPYARVDYVERDGDPVVLELELIEPFLGLERGAGATARFRDTLLAYYEGR